MEATKEQLDNYRVDRTNWASGPWEGEPDREQWQHAGYACLMTRHPLHGYWCGYVGVDRAHPYYRKDWTAESWDLNVHGGVNYSDVCDGHICHVPEPGMPDDVWWLGFDCGHSMDLCPGLEARTRLIPALVAFEAERAERERLLPPSCQRLFREVYRTEGYVKAQVEGLAQQLRALAP